MFKRKAVAPIPLSRWMQDTAAVQALGVIVSNPVYLNAVATLMDVASPHFTTLTPNPEQNSQRLAWLAGYRDAFADLEKLAKVPAQRNQTDPTEWTHINPQ